MKLTHFSLFSGIGGIDLAAEWAGFETVGQCEFADYPTKVLEKHWPDVPRWRDIRDVTAESIRSRGITDVTLLSGGFPCQPFSIAGKRRGANDDRYLWPEMLRVISELNPHWVLGENVPGIVNMALEQCCIDLENQGYEVQPFNIPACAVDAPHRRARIFIVAYSKHQRRFSGSAYFSRGQIRDWAGRLISKNSQNRDERERRTCKSSKDVSNSFSFNGNNGGYGTGKICGKRSESTEIPRSISRSWPTEPELGRVVNGVPNRVDRLKCLGNAVVPQQVYPILQAIADIERSLP